MTNRLAGETSPYLRQHAENPVDWYPWGPEALARARAENKPILVSIGYSACHWCHVMAHESFEDAAVAALMNERFVNIKVDREERPDVDAVYMEAVQALTGSGGWPLNCFLTPEARPFFGGTYFPPQSRHGLPSWTQVLEGVAQAYDEKHDDLLHQADVLTRYIGEAQQPAQATVPLDPGTLQDAYSNIAARFDRTNGGFQGAPKFPQPLALELVLRMYQRTRDPHALSFVLLTLDRMAAGGIHDQLGGGFHRYAVDAVWLVPHFEKMLYDNALLARAYTTAYLATGSERYRAVAESTLDYMLRDLQSPQGAFYSSQDADSEGGEGQYYVWSLDELEDVLGTEDARLAAARYDVTARGNFEGKTILTEALGAEVLAVRSGLPPDALVPRLAQIRLKLLKARASRPPPATDTKILTAWNALAVRSLAEAGRVFEREDYLEAARRAMDFILTALRPAGTLLRSYLDGPGSIPAFLEDHAYCLEALLALSMSVFDARYLEEAQALAREMIDRFGDDVHGGFFDTARDADSLVVRPRGFFDSPIPSGNASAAFALLRLEALTGESEYRAQAESVLRAGSALLTRAPSSVPYLLAAADFYLSTPLQVAITGPTDASATMDLVRTTFARYLPNAVVAVGAPDSAPLLAGRELRGGEPTAYVCEHFVCRLPVTSPGALEQQLEAAAE